MTDPSGHGAGKSGAKRVAKVASVPTPLRTAATRERASSTRAPRARRAAVLDANTSDALAESEEQHG